MTVRPSSCPALATAALVWFVPALAWGDAPATLPSSPTEPVPTIQRRVARKAHTFGVHAIGTATFRGDFYEHAGGGAAVIYYVVEAVGLELRAIGYGAWLNASATELREKTGFIPDTRARFASVLFGSRVSIGYGKLQIADAFLLHFDPQLILSAGLSFAEEGRVLPTFHGGLGLLFHFAHGIQVAIDTLLYVDFEERSRGFVTSLGFAPMLSIGWSFSFEGES